MRQRVALTVVVALSTVALLVVLSNLDTSRHGTRQQVKVAAQGKAKATNVSWNSCTLRTMVVLCGFNSFYDNGYIKDSI